MKFKGSLSLKTSWPFLKQEKKNHTHFNLQTEHTKQTPSKILWISECVETNKWKIFAKSLKFIYIKKTLL